VRQKLRGLAANPAYQDGLRLLARRELSQAQIQQRLERRGHPASQIEEGVARLVEEGAIDDARLAEAIARRETSVKRHGKMRVLLEIERIGIAKPIARRVVDRAFESTDEDELLELSLGKRLRGRTKLADDREHQRLYRYLMAQGFDAERVHAALRKRR
jgi:regulatory protein